MLHRGGSMSIPSVALSGTPRHRRHAAALWPASDQPGGAPSGKRSRLFSSKLLLTTVALSLAVVYSLALYNAGKQAAVHTEAQDSILPGKRHRKLEHGAQREQEQIALAATTQQGGNTSGGSGHAGSLLAATGQESGGSGDAGSTLQQQQQQQQQGEQPQQGAEQQQQPGQVVDGSTGEAAQLAQGTVGSGGGEGEPQVAAGSEGGQSVEEQQQQQQGDTGSGVNADLAAAAEAAAAAAEAAAGGAAGEHAESGAAAAAEQQEGGDNGAAGADGGNSSSGDDNAVGDSTAAGMESNGRRRKSPYHRALESCETLACLKEAAKHKRYKGQFLFPHFLIIGWQKCATTSLFHHLKDHPAVLTPAEKEPEFFSYDCQYNPEACPPEMQKEYIEETLHLNRVLRHNLYRLTFEGSTHYAREGHRMAKSLRRVFPWVKLIASLREPISRYLSMLGHNLDKDTYTCLKKHDLFGCLELELPFNNYTTPFTTWLEAYPREQVMLLQYESLTAAEHEKQHLQAVKSFLGLDPDLPASAELPHSNTRAERLGAEPEGWPLKRWQYERLIQVVRPDAESIAKIVTEYGLGDGQVWMANWEAAWQANLDTCDAAEGAEGMCNIH